MKVLALAAVAAFLVTPAFAAQQCGPADKMFEGLLTQYQEKPAFVAASGIGVDVAVTVTVSPSGTWSMIIQQGPVACIIGAGDKWKVAPTAVIPQSLPGLQKNHLILIHDMVALTDPQRNSWYSSLKSEAGGWCCDLTDAAHIDQKYVRQRTDRNWDVYLTDLKEWVSVPPDRVVKNKPSIDGEPYLFRYPAKLYDGSLIRCFVPPIPGF